MNVAARGQEASSFARPEANYLSMAALVGHDPHQSMRDAPVSNVHRARIPAFLLKKILEDIHVSLNQYGPAEDHETQEARSRFMAPVCLSTPIHHSFPPLHLLTP